MDQPRSGFGYIGFFDILGYQSFLENNEAELATSEVISIISNIGKYVTTTIQENMTRVSDAPESENPHAEFMQGVDAIRWLIFSDTVLMLMDDEGPDLFSQLFRAMAFNLAAGVLFRHMFAFGLPLRGAIARGSFVYSNNCFAGRAIVESYRLASSLELSACAIHESFLDAGKNKMHPSVGTYWNVHLVPYLTPTHDGHKKITLLNHLFSPPPETVTRKRNLRQEVLDQFWAHGKDIGPEAEIKAVNTEKFVRYLMHKVTVNPEARLQAK